MSYIDPDNLTVDTKMEYKIIEGFERELAQGKYVDKNYDLDSSKARNKYNKYINDIAAFNPREYKVTDFSNIGTSSILELSAMVVFVLFGERAMPDFEEFLSVLRPSGSNCVLDGVNLTGMAAPGQPVVNLVLVPDLETSSNVVTIVHEFVHFYLRKLNLDFNKKMYYEEILTIYAEKVANIILSQELKDPKFGAKIEECRLEGILWHYKQNLVQLDFLSKHYTEMKLMAEFNPLAKMNQAKIEADMPYLKTPEGIKVLKSYYQNLSDSYGIGYLYAETLLRKFLEDPEKMEDDFKKLIEQTITLQQLLDSYNINAKNYEVYNNVTERLDHLRLIRKI